MNIQHTMNLYSPSGYAMPFEADENTPIEVARNYGKHVNEKTGEESFSHGMDFRVCRGTWLKALATGVVSGISSDTQNGFSLTVNYPNYADGKRSCYDVIYSHISEAVCNFGKNVKAGDNVARCDGLLHVEVRFNGEETDPLEFLTMIRDNLIVNSQKDMSGTNPEIATLDFDVHTPYDAQQTEIDQLMMRYFGSYMTDLLSGNYHVPTQTEQGLRNVIAEGARNGAYYEHTPSMLNPLGLGHRSFSIIERVQTILITDFLNYLALMHSVFLSSMSEIEKKAADRAVESQGVLDPLADFEIDIQSFDIQRTVSVYPDRDGIVWWTKAWFNGRKKGERAIEISRALAIKFIHDDIQKDEWLEEFFPKQMEVLHAALAQTREQVINQYQQTVV